MTFKRKYNEPKEILSLLQCVLKYLRHFYDANVASYRNVGQRDLGPKARSIWLCCENVLNLRKSSMLL